MSPHLVRATLAEDRPTGIKQGGTHFAVLLRHRSNVGGRADATTANATPLGEPLNVANALVRQGLAVGEKRARAASVGPPVAELRPGRRDPCSHYEI